MTSSTEHPKRAIFTVMEDLLEEFGDPNWRDPDRPLVQLVSDWHSFPETREGFLTSIPPKGADPHHLTKIAAVVHALCDYSGYTVPEWVYSYRSEKDVNLFCVPINSRLSDRIRTEAPASCAYHKIWFEESFILPKRHGLVNPLRGVSPEEFRGMLNIIDPEPLYRDGDAISR